LLNYGLLFKIFADLEFKSFANKLRKLFVDKEIEKPQEKIEERPKSEVIPEDIIKPHPLQGRLAIQIKKDRKDLMQIFKGLDEKE